MSPYNFHMGKKCLLLLSTLAVFAGVAGAHQAPPRENPYEVIGKILQPFLGVLLTESNGADRATEAVLVLSEVSGRLPQAMKGAELKARVQFPDKVLIEAPVLGEQLTVCRNGDKVWATPGQKIEFLLSSLHVVPKKPAIAGTPLSLPISAQQAIFLPALFSVPRADVAEVEDLNGETCRVISAKLMPELARSLKAEDFQATLWVAPGHKIRRLRFARRDFSATIDVKTLVFLATLPESTWEPTASTTDIHRTDTTMLEGLLHAVMNSLQGPTAEVSLNSH
jgi:hypothetical protein